MKFLRALTEMPWEYQGDDVSSRPDGAALNLPAEKVALRFFLGVVFVLFALFATAYVVRMELADWRPMPESPLLWFNTLLLFLSSIALQWTVFSVRGRSRNAVSLGLLLSVLLTLGFVAGQLSVWEGMSEAGYIIYGNPANSFFYVLTGLHALHILGGLYVLIKAVFRVWSGASREATQLSVELCAVYWHFLFLVWLVLFALLSYT